MKRIIQGMKSTTLQLWVLQFLFLMVGIFICLVIFKNPMQLGITPGSVWQERFLLLAMIMTGGVMVFIMVFFMATYLFGQSLYRQTRRLSSSKFSNSFLTQKNENGNYSARISDLKAHLYRRYGRFWQRKVRLISIHGDSITIEKVLPGLQAQLWLESTRTVFIYGGSLAEEIDIDKYIALGKLRRRSPLNGIIRVLGSKEFLTEQISDADLRGLQIIGKTLRFQPPVWLWQLHKSEWSQSKRVEQPVSAFFPLDAKPEDIEQQLRSLLPRLNAQGLNQVLENNDHDFLLRLAQQLEKGGIAHWVQQLTPWLYGKNGRIPFRGLVLSLEENRDELTKKDPYKDVSSLMISQGHALMLPVALESVIDDCSFVKGSPVGNAWHQTVAMTSIAFMGIWGVGLLYSYYKNHQQIAIVAEKTHALFELTTLTDQQLILLHSLHNDVKRLEYHVLERTPWYSRFGLDHSAQLLTAILPWYGAANNRHIRDPASFALQNKLNSLANLPPNSPLRTQFADSGYDQLKAWMMMSRPDKVDATFYTKIMKTVQPTRDGIASGLWQSLSPDLWTFYLSQLPSQPHWEVVHDAQLINQVRQILLQQLGRRNAESTLYDTMLESVRRNVTDMTLEDMTKGTDVRQVFTTDEVVPGMFTRQAWENGVQQAIEAVARTRREEIDWVLSDGRDSVSEELSPEALKERLTHRYFVEFSSSWLRFLNSLQWHPVQNIADVTDQLTLVSDVRQSPVIALMNTLAWQGLAGQKTEGLSDSLMRSARDLITTKEKPVIEQNMAGPKGPLDETFGPLLTLMGKNKAENMISTDSSLSLQSYLTRLTRVRLRLQQVASSTDPQATMQMLAQTVFQGKSIDLTDTQQYGGLIAASLGEEWSGFGRTLFVQPLIQAWETVLQPAAASLNDKWKRVVVAPWNTAFNDRYPFTATKNDTSLPMLAEFIRKDSGRLEQFLSSELSGVLRKEGNQWVPDSAHSQGLNFNPAFLKAVNQLSLLSDILFTDGNQSISFDLQARPVRNVVETQLNIDGQTLRYFNQMAEWQHFHWPGDTYKPGTQLTWTSTAAGARLFGDYGGSWGFIRWLEQGKQQRLNRSQWMMSFMAPDGNTLQWVLRSQLENGPLALLSLRGFHLPDAIFNVDKRGELSSASHFQQFAARDEAN